MPQFLVAVMNPDDFSMAGNEDGRAMMRDIDALNREMVAAGVRDFAGGLEPAAKAKVIRAQQSGGVLVSDGPFVDATEHIGGVWMLTCKDMDEAVEWARKATVACRVPIEVRQFLELPAEWKTGVAPE